MQSYASMEIPDIVDKDASYKQLHAPSKVPLSLVQMILPARPKRTLQDLADYGNVEAD